jgi:hypothetical protein
MGTVHTHAGIMMYHSDLEVSLATMSPLSYVLAHTQAGTYQLVRPYTRFQIVQQLFGRPCQGHRPVRPASRVECFESDAMMRHSQIGLVTLDISPPSGFDRPLKS